MKKITSFLMVLFVALGAMAQEAETPSWDFAALCEQYPSKTTMTYSDETTKVGGTASNLGTGEYEGLAMQGADKWFTYNGGLYQGNGGGRKIGVLNLVKGQIITIVASGECLSVADSGTAAEMSVSTADGKTTYVYVMLADGTLALTMTRYFVLFSIVVENPDPNAGSIAVTGISLNKSTAAIPEGMTVNLLAATVEPVNATDQTVTWASSAENIATVDNGVVTGLVPGKATITATAGGFSATCEVTVTEKASKTSWDFAALYETYGNKAGMTYAVNTVKIGGADCNYGIGEYEGLAAQGANGWFLYVDGGLYNGNAGYRNLGVLDLKEGQIVTVVANTETELTLADTNTATQLSVETVGGKSTYIYGMIADGALALKMVRNKVIISIKVEDARELVITDANDFAPEYDAYSSATYTRTIEEGAYGTICLPFAPDAASLENYTFFKMESAGADAINFVEETAPVANTPYIYCLKGENVAITGGATVVSADINSVEVGNWIMKGSFTKQTIATAGADTKFYGYVADQNKIVKANKTLTVLPCRAYFTAPVDAAAVALRITRGDETTEITAADLDVQPATVIYDLAGRRVEKMEKGIYIVNGKKVIR